MYHVLHRRLNYIAETGLIGLLRESKQGIEKESLRVTPSGAIAQTSHLFALGSALTHPYITTDYSEALLEFITPALESTEQTLEKLGEIHRFVATQLDGERLWINSMPCMIHSEQDIPVAVYGSSNSGLLRHVYRRGLALRYGRIMQVISGVHYNFSLPLKLWPILHAKEAATMPLQAFVDQQYMALIRNVLRYGWLLLYLFGASPAADRSFLSDGVQGLSRFDSQTVYGPYATSLRMSDIGYSNRNHADLDVSYNSLRDYINSLAQAIETPYVLYEKMEVIGANGHQQLNPNILQIENEYYSTVRPKRPPQRGEKPTIALHNQGVEYVEVRSLDVDPYATYGISLSTLRFMKIFLWFCALQDSPDMDASEFHKVQLTLTDVAYRGRDPELMLACTGEAKGVRVCASELLEQMDRFAEAMDDSDAGFSMALAEQKERVNHPETLSSARILAEMREKKQSFFEFGKEYMEKTHQALLANTLHASTHTEFETLACRSHARQQELERKDNVDFATYLERYLSQSILQKNSLG